MTGGFSTGQSLWMILDKVFCRNDPPAVQKAFVCVIDHGAPAVGVYRFVYTIGQLVVGIHKCETALGKGVVFFQHCFYDPGAFLPFCICSAAHIFLPHPVCSLTFCDKAGVEVDNGDAAEFIEPQAGIGGFQEVINSLCRGIAEDVAVVDDLPEGDHLIRKFWLAG